MEKRPNTTVQKLISFFIWSHAITLSLVYSLLLGPYVMFRFITTDFLDNFTIWGSSECSEDFLLYLQISIFISFALSMGCIAIVHWFLKKKAFAAKKYIYAFLLIAFSIILFPILKDDPLIESNYTWNDVSMPSNHVEESYQALQKLLWDDRINSKLSGIDLSEAKKNPLL